MSRFSLSLPLVSIFCGSQTVTYTVMFSTEFNYVCIIVLLVVRDLVGASSSWAKKGEGFEKLGDDSHPGSWSYGGRLSFRFPPWHLAIREAYKS